MSEAEGYYFEDLKIGMSAERTRTVTQGDIYAFSQITGDTNPIHLDEDWAARTRFQGRIAHGVLTAGHISALIGTELPGPGNIYMRQTLEFRAPVRDGDAVTTRVEITELDPIKNRVHLSTTCSCAGTEVLRGTALLFVHSRSLPL